MEFIRLERKRAASSVRNIYSELSEGFVQCPNCGKEALNVNGKYVCLDCGIEVASPADTQTTPVETPQTSRSFGSNEDTALDTASDLSSTASVSDTSKQSNLTPDVNANAVSEDSIGVSSIQDQNSAISDINTIAATQDSGATDSGQNESQTVAQDLTPKEEPQKLGEDRRGSVKDYYLDALKQSAEEKSGSYDFDTRKSESDATDSTVSNMPSRPDTAEDMSQTIQADSATAGPEEINAAPAQIQDISQPNYGDSPSQPMPNIQVDLNRENPQDDSMISSSGSQDLTSEPQEVKAEEVPSQESQETSQENITDIPEQTPGQEESLEKPTTEEPLSQPDELQKTNVADLGDNQDNYFQPSGVDITPTSQSEDINSQPQDQSGQSEDFNQGSQTQENEQGIQDGFDAYSIPAGIGTGEPLVEDLASQSQGVSQDSIQPMTQDISEIAESQPSKTASDYTSKPLSEPSAGEANLDNLLNKYAGQSSQTQSQAPSLAESSQTAQQGYVSPSQSPAVDTVMPSIVPSQSGYEMTGQAQSSAPSQDLAQNQNNATFPQADQPMPGAGDIPSTESVFGAGVGESSASYEEPLVPDQPIKKRKTGLFVIVGFLVILLIAGMVYLGFILSRSRNSAESQPTAQDLMFSLSDQVSKAMDAPQNMTVTFDQSLDFTKATPKTPEGGITSNVDVLKLLFAGPVTAKGNWQIDNLENLVIDAKFTNLAEKKIFITADKSTYVLGTDGQWSKSDGMQITQIPPLFSSQNRGGLFYLTKVNALTEQGSETIDGKLYKKIKVDPKPDFVESILSSSNTALSETKYDAANVENLEILAWIDDDGKIFRVTAKGDIGITSDLYEGTVSIKSEAKYDYKATEIKKPEGV